MAIKKEEDYIENSCIAVLSEDQIAFLKKASTEIYAMCMEAVKNVINNKRYDEFGIGNLQARYIETSWADHKNASSDLCNRFDFCWDGDETLKFYEINADVPGTIYEASVIQAEVLKDLMQRGQVPAHAKQFNGIENSLLGRFKTLDDQFQSRADVFHFSAMLEDAESLTSTLYLEALAQKAGWKTKFVDLNLIGANTDPASSYYATFFDHDDQEIQLIYKLMAWEHIFESDFSTIIPDSKTHFIEPAWKAILSNKMLSVVLWEMFPDSPYLLPTYTSAEKFSDSYVEKPIFGRGSEAVKIHLGDQIIRKKPDTLNPANNIFDDYPKVYQDYHPLPEVSSLKGYHYLTSTWVTPDGQACGLEFRMDRSLITEGHNVKFLSHYVV